MSGSFLIWQTAFLGDVVLATSLVLTLKENFPSSRIAFVGRPFIKELFKGWDVELIAFSKGFLESFRIRKVIRGFDVAIVPHRSLRTALIMLFSSIPRRIGFDRSEFRWAFTDTVPHLWGLHEIDRNLKLLEPLGVDKFVRKTYLPMGDEEMDRVLSNLGLEKKGYILVNPFSNFPLKEWSLENWARIINRLVSEGIEVVVSGLKSDLEKARRLKEMANFKNLVGKTSLRELMAVIKGSKFVLSNDSSPVHIANAFGVPAITIYTATSSRYGFYPIKGGYIDNPAPCSPCSPNPKRCKTGTLECLSLPSPDDVFKVLEGFL